ncbi:MAG TPA: bifunctional diaminohydroxyphosphoribosylaminopyrimidine deaminase/5-amino-6-(5-phosphoribosylamino)uracil reductase RibD [Solirubrobacteraceae bacterium]|nr:bifunctional diaminohydroxyphosphoribosylaminopyrimidine deaminase/5-amino-6-(5-phosphoribosylamino)uracil reductase RibD [Solirubrobacteraceae bacterium]
MSVASDTDARHIARAIELARRGIAGARPNPIVGAVVARGDAVLGEGWHSEFGGAHAEVNAIEACGTEDLADTTMYVSLEPCCHEGKTPPCTQAIIDAGIRRVVVASDDPSEKASGRGLGILRDEGIDVVTIDGSLAGEARLLNQAFRKHARTGRPWVLFKSAMTLDGKVATRSGDSQWISSEASRDLAHQWRATVDAVVVGIGTALADDPQLTARPSTGTPEPGRQPRRVVFDSLARLPPDSRLLEAAAEVPLTVVVSRAAARADTEALAAAGAQIMVATGENEPARVASALELLGEDGVTSLLLEGGPHLAGAFLDAGEIDELRLFLAPMLLGGSTARDPLEGGGVDKIADAVRALTLDVDRVGDDLLIKARLREW